MSTWSMVHHNEAGEEPFLVPLSQLCRARDVPGRSVFRLFSRPGVEDSSKISALESASEDLLNRF